MAPLEPDGKRAVWHVRPARADDWPAIEATRLAAISSPIGPALSAREQAAWLTMPMTDLRAVIGVSEGACVVGEAVCAGSGVAGYAWASAGARPHLRALYVEPGARRQGLGSVLLHAVERQLLEQGASELFVAAAPGAVDFYRHCGYAVDCEFMLPLRDDEGPVALRLRKMWKRLA
ncbi:GNAT family N-acetyltransferase [Paraburkholderia oxyphila]|uniref:GNAT family N-acetyltransferase n=1 Tax=Paraburkholderia oxyphila TaxID=614212 RepID=UPI000483CEDF|nr:GNAT family N-acetyltransferase [Paraburkholderia oxyphila]